MGTSSVITKIYKSPCGDLVLGSYSDKLCLCDWYQEHIRDHKRLCSGLKAGFTEGTSSIIGEAIIQLDEYFAGSRRDFDIQLMFVGTDFQKKVWHEVLRIPYGHTVSYGKIAKNIGRPTSVRAVANAVGTNVISIFTPCHRVIGSAGTLTGYAGGLEAKRFLLNLEGFSSGLFES